MEVGSGKERKFCLSLLEDIKKIGTLLGHPTIFGNCVLVFKVFEMCLREEEGWVDKKLWLWLIVIISFNS